MEPCPLCGQTKAMKHPRLLYDHFVCRKCVNRFANRRQLAYLVDIVLINILYVAISVVAGILVYALSPTEEVLNQLISVAHWPAMAITMGAFVARDAVGGRSIGKLLTGVQAFDMQTGRPAGFVASAKRNLPLLIPFAPLLAAINMMKGFRWGDGWAHTKVVWLRYADHPVFHVGGEDELEELQEQLVTLPDEPGDANPYRAARY